MARGKRQYVRLAKPMGYVDLDKNEFDDFLGKKRRGRRLGGLATLGKNLSECAKKASRMRFASAQAKKDFLKDCMKSKGTKRDRSIAGILKDRDLLPPTPNKRPSPDVIQKKGIANKVLEASMKQKGGFISKKGGFTPKGRLADPSLGLGETPTDVGVPKDKDIISPANPKGNTNGINPVDEGGTTMTPPPVAEPTKKGGKKLLLYVAIGVVVLIVGNKLIK
tara:strand:+ start:325 stop:990 length:666 start_codon:yes stop_codon:yes gene_type:complete